MRRLMMGLLLGGISMLGGPAMGADKAEEGKPAPAVSLTAASKGKEIKVDLADYKGKKNVVLFFYPKAMTGG
ncbi:MAG: redoxin domain-containing protein [Gemmataceae bacterium]|nr:redoxin domain-containing protein [Gemmataceae bacterium]